MVYTYADMHVWHTIVMRDQEVNVFINTLSSVSSLHVYTIEVSSSSDELVVSVSLKYRHCRELALHASRPVAECPISFVANVCGCWKLLGTHIARAQVPLVEHNCSGYTVYQWNTSFFNQTICRRPLNTVDGVIHGWRIKSLSKPIASSTTQSHFGLELGSLKFSIHIWWGHRHSGTANCS